MALAQRDGNGAAWPVLLSSAWGASLPPRDCRRGLGLIVALTPSSDPALIQLGLNASHPGGPLQKDPGTSHSAIPFPSLCWASQMSQGVMVEKERSGTMSRFTSSTAVCYIAVSRAQARGRPPRHPPPQSAPLPGFNS